MVENYKKIFLNFSKIECIIEQKGRIVGVLPHLSILIHKFDIYTITLFLIEIKTGIVSLCLMVTSLRNRNLRCRCRLAPAQNATIYIPFLSAHSSSLPFCICSGLHLSKFFALSFSDEPNYLALDWMVRHFKYFC